MAGRPGRSGGHNRIDPAVHLLRGTFNPTRHVPVTPPGLPPWQAPAADLAALGDAGRAFLAHHCAAYDFSPLEGAVALEVAIMADRLADLRASRPRVKAAERARLDRRELAWQRAYTNGVQWLRSRARVHQAPAQAPASKWAGSF